jgi:Bacterial archaeo-eukaryotic release factor family 7
MDIFTRDATCVSIYMPTYRNQPEAKQNPIRYKNLLKQMEERLVAGGIRKAHARVFSKPARGLIKDTLFWQYQSDGFAAFLNSHGFQFYRLPAFFEELLVVADRFHVKPLLHLLADDGRFYVLALSQNEVRFFQCSRHSIAEVELERVPGNLGEALQYDDPQKQLQIHTSTPVGRGGRPAIFHGHGAGTEDAKKDILRFFQLLDEGLRKAFAVTSGPLVLAGVDYLFPIYREANSHPFLLQEGIPGNPEGMKPEELHKEAWKIVEPYFLKSREEAAARYRQAAGSPIASRDVKTIALAAYHARVEVLHVAVGVHQWGTYDGSTVHLHEQEEPGDEDVLDFAAIHTLLNGGTVHAVKPEEVPDVGHLAAIFRY